jgi:hypothetical protein
MYVQHSVHIERPVSECALALERSPRTWFPRLRSDHATEVGLRVAGISVRKSVSIDLGAPEKKGEWVSVPVEWRATFPEKLFPVLVGKIELSPAGKRETRLTVSGMYEAPLGKMGALVDEAIMHSVAQATVKELTQAIATQLSAG